MLQAGENTKQPTLSAQGYPVAGTKLALTSQHGCNVAQSTAVLTIDRSAAAQDGKPPLHQQTAVLLTSESVNSSEDSEEP